MPKVRRKTILVAGGSGFVGSHLCDALIHEGHFVIALDNLSTGNKKNVAHLLAHQNFKFVKGDVTETKPAFKQIEHYKVDEIFHLASPASPPHYQKDAIATWKANTVGTLNLLELARKSKAKFLFASTSEIYGDPQVHPQVETYWGNVNPVGIRACYDESKRAGETLVMDYRRQFGLNAKIVRIFNTYGPRMDKNDGRVVSNFVNQALAQKPITVYGSGKQTRSFQYADDLINGLLKFMASNLTGPMNLGNPKEFTVLELAKKVLSLTKSKSKIVFKQLPQDDPKQRRPDISFAKNKLGWTPRVNLEKGLKKIIEYFTSVI
jgi:UDP-glucuronate decarboxylase